MMKFLIIGLGSMGKRRIRNLNALGYKLIAGFDIREDRRLEATSKYGIIVFDDFEHALEEFAPDALIISTSPKYHMEYAFRGADEQLSCFIEASVVEADKILALANKIKEIQIVIVPSCTMRYCAGPKKVKEIIESGLIGKPLNLNYQTGQFLPDWHPWEKIEEFYVSDRQTGGCREIVPFEVTWLNNIFGQPEPLACVKAKITDLEADIDDIYHCLLCYPGNMLANITVEVISRPQPTRELRILGSKGELVFSADENCVRYINTDTDKWMYFPLPSGTIEANYINPEEPYISEIADFIEAIKRQDRFYFSNSLEDDAQVLRILYELEELAKVTNL